MKAFRLMALLSAALVSIAGAAEKVVFTGDSTVASKSGWGDAFAALMKPEVAWTNIARGGRSSKSYRDEGWWDKALAEKPTWVFIQFGHNDQPGKGPKRETDPQTTYADNLRRYVSEAREAGAKPILVTSLTRRNFNEEGRIDPQNLSSATDTAGGKRPDNLTEYAVATKAVAAELEVPVIDLNTISVAHLNELGPEAAEKFDPPTSGHPDKTHLSAYGAKETAAWVAEAVREEVPDFRPLLKEP